MYLFLQHFLSFCLCWVFITAHRLSLVAASGAPLQLQVAFLAAEHRLTGFSNYSTRAQQLQLTASVVMILGLSCSTACGIFPEQGSNPCTMHWQVDSYPLHHQGSPTHTDTGRTMLGAVGRIVCTGQEGEQDHFLAIALIYGKRMVAWIKMVMKVVIRHSHIQCRLINSSFKTCSSTECRETRETDKVRILV